MHRAHFKVVAFFVGFLFSLNSVAVQNDTQALIDILTDLQDMQADFDQLVQNEQGQVLQSAKGEMRLAKPKQFFWQIHSPDRQTLVLKETTLQVVDHDLEQVILQSVDQALSGNPALLLSSDPQQLGDYYEVDRHVLAGELEQYVLKPKQSEALFQDLIVLFAQGALLSMHLQDNFGQQTAIHFSQVRTNQKLLQQAFEFDIPKQYDVIDYRDSLIKGQ